MSPPNFHTSGDGTRPVTDATADNIGAGQRFNPSAPDNSAPAGKDGPAGKRADRASAQNDDSAPMGMTDSAKSTPNTEPPATARENNEDR